MPLFIDARTLPAHRFRIWDSTTNAYVTGELNVARVMSMLRRLLREGGLGQELVVADIVERWTDEAIRRGTNDPTQKTVPLGETADPKAPPTLLSPWRTSPEPGDACGELQRAVWANALARQAIDALCDRRFEERLEGLSEDARAFLRETFVLERLRAGAKATVRAIRAPRVPPHGYRDLAHARALVDEIAQRWRDVLIVTVTDPYDREAATFTFRLR